MTASTMPDVIDLLLTGIRSSLADQTILVSDGYPPGANPTITVSVGGLSSPTAVSVQSWAYLGAKSKFERYKVEIVVSVMIGGDGQQSQVTGADAQKSARDMAYSVVHAIETYLIATATPSLNHFFNTGPRKGGWCGLEDMELKQTDDMLAAAGCIAEVVMQLGVTAII